MPPLIRKKFLWFLILFNLVTLPALYWRGHPAFFHGTPADRSPDLPIYGQMPAFELVRENGGPFTDRQMAGGPWVADFIFTRCPNQCPMMSVKFAALQKNLPSEVRLASFSVDADYDTPEKLDAYAKNYKADGTRWVFLTGNKKIVAAIRQALHLGGEEDPGMHSLRFVLLDKQLRARGYYDSQDTESLKKMRLDIDQLGAMS